MKTLLPALTITLAMSLAATGPARAHHSAAMFDPARSITLKGVVESWQWTNPHSWLNVQVDDDKGGVVLQRLEIGSPNTLFRSGWRTDTFRPGDQVTVTFHPLKDGQNGGALISAIAADGKLMTWLPAEKPAGTAAE